MSKKRILLLPLVLLLFFNTLRAQQFFTEGFVQATPLEASKLLDNYAFGTNPVTGLLDIKIPLFTIKAGGIDIPIQLSYNSGGIKVSETSGMVGLGWNINLTPSIVRTVNNAADENGYLKNTYLGQIYNPTYRENFQKGNGYTDEEPDDFYYNLINSSGRFTYRKLCAMCQTPSYDFSLYPLKNFKISQPDLNIFSFTIIDDHGIKYEFADPDNIGNYTDRDNQYPVASKVRRITFPHSRDTVSYEYERLRYFAPANEFIADYFSIENGDGALSPNSPNQYQSGPSPSYDDIQGMTEREYGQYLSMIEDRLDNGLTYDIRMKHLYGNSLWTSEAHIRDNETGLIQHGWRTPRPMSSYSSSPYFNYAFIKKINFPEGYIEILRNNRLNLIEQIKVFNYKNELLETVGFVYLAINDQKRLLKEIVIGSDINKNKYVFDYYDMYNVPNVFEKRFDHWGYFNNLGDGITSVPSFEEDVIVSDQLAKKIFSGAIKDPVLIFARTGTLKSITYPTKGSAEFEYELNTYKDNEDDQIKEAGGLRIKKVSYKESDHSRLLIKEFKYGNEGVGDGIINKKPVFEDYVRESYLTYHTLFTPLGYEGLYSLPLSKLKLIRSYPFQTLSFRGGWTVVYPTVSEYIFYEDPMTMEKTCNGKTIYRYRLDDLVDRHYTDNQGRLILDFKNDDWRYLELSGKEYYSYDINEKRFMKARKEIYEYELSFDETKAVTIGKMAAGNTIFRPESVVPPQDYQDLIMIDYLSYQDVPGVNLLKKRSVIDYVDNDSIVVDVSFIYDHYNQLSQEVSSSSRNNRQTIKNFVYPYNPYTIGGLNGNYLLTNANMLAQVIESSIYDTPRNPVDIYDRPKKVEHQLFEFKSSYGLIVPSRTYSYFGNDLDEGLILSSFVKSLDFLRYDNCGNPLEVGKPGGLISSYIWGYGKRYPIAKIDNSTYDGITSILGLAVFDQLHLPGVADAYINYTFSILRDSPSMKNAQISSYTYKPLTGMTSMTDPRGIKTEYTYDGFQRLKDVLDFEGNFLKNYRYHYKP